MRLQWKYFTPCLNFLTFPNSLTCLTCDMSHLSYLWHVSLVLLVWRNFFFFFQTYLQRCDFKSRRRRSRGGTSVETTQFRSQISGFSFCYFCLFVCLSVCPSVPPSVCPSVYPFVCLSVCLSVWLSVCLTVCLSVCLSAATLEFRLRISNFSYCNC
jgi:hypothetical protein